MHCVNFLNALINMLLTQPDPSKERVSYLCPVMFRGPPVEYRKHIETHFSTITDVTVSIEIH